MARGAVNALEETTMNIGFVRQTSYREAKRSAKKVCSKELGRGAHTAILDFG